MVQAMALEAAVVPAMEVMLVEAALEVVVAVAMEL